MKKLIILLAIIITFISNTIYCMILKDDDNLWKVSRNVKQGGVIISSYFIQPQDTINQNVQSFYADLIELKAQSHRPKFPIVFNDLIVFSFTETEKNEAIEEFPSIYANFFNFFYPTSKEEDCNEAISNISQLLKNKEDNATWYKKAAEFLLIIARQHCCDAQKFRQFFEKLYMPTDLNNPFLSRTIQEKLTTTLDKINNTEEYEKNKAYIFGLLIELRRCVYRNPADTFYPPAITLLKKIKLYDNEFKKKLIPTLILVKKYDYLSSIKSFLKTYTITQQPATLYHAIINQLKINNINIDTLSDELQKIYSEYINKISKVH